MNILFFSQAAWDNKNSVGNTFSNLFDGEAWKNDNIFHIYARENLPDNDMNITYYHISASSIINGCLRNKKKAFEYNSNQLSELKAKTHSNAEKRKIDSLHKSKKEIVYWAHELIWRTQLWEDKQFFDFIERSSPSVFYAFATSSYILWPLIQYLRKNTKCKVVLLIADDTYGACEKLAWYRRKYQKLELKKCIEDADKLYAISDEMAQLYKRRFGRPVTTLCKGCDLSLQPKNFINTPLRLIYAGNLLWGRDTILKDIAVTLKKINVDGIKARLEIYTGTTITPEISNKLNYGESSKIMGSCSYNEIKQIMHDSDVVLHVESFDENSIESVRYSLSTKIIDCLQSGSQVLGIGPKGIASIEYLKKVDGAMVIDDVDEIENGIKRIIAEPEAIQERVLKTRQYAMAHHEIGRVQIKFRQEIEILLHS